jgi:hypothetical protein
MFDLDQIIKERDSTRMFLPQQPVPRELVNEALALAVHAPSNSNISRGTWCSRPERSGTASLPPSSTRPGDGRPISHPCQSRSRTFAEIWVFKSTGRWESLARTRRASGCGLALLGVLPHATGWHYLHAPGPRLSRRPQRGDTSANVALSLDRTRPRRLSVEKPVYVTRELFEADIGGGMKEHPQLRAVTEERRREIPQRVRA